MRNNNLIFSYLILLQFIFGCSIDAGSQFKNPELIDNSMNEFRLLLESGLPTIEIGIEYGEFGTESSMRITYYSVKHELRDSFVLDRMEDLASVIFSELKDPEYLSRVVVRLIKDPEYPETVYIGEEIMEIYEYEQVIKRENLEN
ncbi:hypothetical protein [Flavilitoribacter nigricans]|uniref:Uncharacterized protein n=1 Tax=Flavilitoribacter nigricans (strain ATCC 23147 / DSM 23189 / NBRC 102662 / NCIMB 1420 / SS-2) TaxID=1122177 RepID=A0A2D0MX80_FLAN2|nr:hypothetical protein [Flavilitoribacter nigricans]PHN00746.1 hypothetical protein CRP01_40515 [Flavilitoribacter nigricans DSM 23189 = NBRC 102662]